MPDLSPQCPNSAATGCLCPEHHPGLMLTSAPERSEALLKALTGFAKDKPPTRLTAVPDVPIEVGCAGTFTCECRKCVKERSNLVRIGASRDRAQPWEPKPMRRAA